MEFLGFDGINYKCCDFSNIISNFKHYILLKSSSKDRFYLIVFNNSLDITYNGSQKTIELDASCIEYLSNNGGEWSSSSKNSKYYFSATGVPIVYSDLTQLSEYFVNNKEIHYIHEDATEPVEPVVPVQPTAYIVSNSVKDVNFDKVFTDLFDILPVVLSVIVSLVAIRKGISYMRKKLIMS